MRPPRDAFYVFYLIVELSRVFVRVITLSRMIHHMILEFPVSVSASRDGFGFNFSAAYRE